MLLCKLLFRGRKLYALKIIVCSRSKKIQAENSNSYFTAIKTILNFDFLFVFIFQIFEFSGMLKNIFQNSLHHYHNIMLQKINFFLFYDIVSRKYKMTTSTSSVEERLPMRIKRIIFMHRRGIFLP